MFWVGVAMYAQQPNFIIILTDDISWNDLGCYGNEFAKTPNIDQLAAEGLQFNNAYLTASSCSPSRTSMISGRYPHNTGSCELHTPLPDDQVVFPEYLKNAGYYTVLSGKNHMGDAVNKGFDLISKGRGPGKEEDWLEILKERPKDKPFFFWFASADAHRPWQTDENTSKYDPNDMKIPPFLIDGPKTRQDFANYMHEVSRTDTYTGVLRKELQRQGIEGDTYFIYMSDNGRPFPRCKTRLYDSGIKTPFLIARPGFIKPGITNSLISSIDIAPTVLELAGIKKEERIQGVSFTSILNFPMEKTRDYVFAEHNWHVHQAHERMVRWKNWVFIRNAFPERQIMCVEASDAYPAGKELWETEKKGLLNSNQKDIFLIPRPAIELYNLEKDPDQLHNIAFETEHKDIINYLTDILDQWSDQTGDTIPENPTNDRQDAHGNKYVNHKRGTMPGEEKKADKIYNPGPILSDN